MYVDYRIHCSWLLFSILCSNRIDSARVTEGIIPLTQEIADQLIYDFLYSCTKRKQKHNPNEIENSTNANVDVVVGAGQNEMFFFFLVWWSMIPRQHAE